MKSFKRILAVAMAALFVVTTMAGTVMAEDFNGREQEDITGSVGVVTDVDILDSGEEVDLDVVAETNDDFTSTSDQYIDNQLDEESTEVESSIPGVPEDSEIPEVVTEEDIEEETTTAPEQTIETTADEDQQSEMPLLEAAASGTCGDNLTWQLDDQGVLTIKGSGAMASYTSASNIPWFSNRVSVLTVVIDGAYEHR